MCLSAAPQSEYTFSDCVSSSAPGGSAQRPSSHLAAGEERIFNIITLNIFNSTLFAYGIERLYSRNLSSNNFWNN